MAANPLGGPSKAPPPAPASAAGEPSGPASDDELITSMPQWYLVKVGGDMMHQSRAFTLKKGETINGSSYDVEALKNAGIELEACKPPRWAIQAARAGEVKAQALRAAAR